MLRLADIFTEEELQQRKAQRDAEYRRLTTEFPVNCPSCHKPDRDRDNNRYFYGEGGKAWMIGHRCRNCHVWICLDALAVPAHASTSGAH